MPLQHCRPAAVTPQTINVNYVDSDFICDKDEPIEKEKKDVRDEIIDAVNPNSIRKYLK